MKILLSVSIICVFVATLSLNALADEPIAGGTPKPKAKAAVIVDQSKKKAPSAKIDDDHSRVKSLPIKQEGLNDMKVKK